ncbi:hypothetical protein SPFL3102_02437 [Sporomusaceae bacterium FL31]|nr:hypothetical protein SPFL3101_02147 [Sporomusaceae bacterium FL31]GCE34620.1 hypothetical protein SPFL3102_02437 [Sporomusaceae bacterium]
MDKNRDIQPVGAIANILKVKPLGKVRVFKRPEYSPNQKRRKTMNEQEDNQEHQEEQLINRARESAEGLGGRVDFKV